MFKPTVFVLGLSSVALAGCTTDQAMNARPASATYQSAKSIPAMEECLAQGFGWAGRATVIHGESRVVIDYGNVSPILTFTIFTRNGQTIVEERHPHRKLAIDIRRRIAECVDGAAPIEGAR